MTTMMSSDCPQYDKGQFDKAEVEVIAERVRRLFCSAGINYKDGNALFDNLREIRSRKRNDGKE
jgi:hypothetical protein